MYLPIITSSITDYFFINKVNNLNQLFIKKKDKVSGDIIDGVSSADFVFKNAYVVSPSHIIWVTQYCFLISI